MRRTFILDKPRKADRNDLGTRPIIRLCAVGADLYGDLAEIQSSNDRRACHRRRFRDQDGILRPGEFLRRFPLAACLMNFTILAYDSIDSTNTEALKQARQGADEGLCILARQQTAGRGRRGRTWVSEKDAGLYFSIVLRPKIETKYLTLITLMAAVAVH